MKLLIFMQYCSQRKMLQFGVWQIVVRHFLLTVDHLLWLVHTADKTVLSRLRRRCQQAIKLLGLDQSQDTIKRAIYQLLKILTVMIRAHDRRAKCCLDWHVYDIRVNCAF